ncbi:ribose-phosphate diphosphokinase [Candidatus Woesearchaeota archaeon]|nr:ribose-phosphate diphosphokinase [Candidatus Woesearchaeota archaeon]
MKKIVLSFSYSQKLGRNLAKKLNCKFSMVKIKEFPDKEKLIQLNADVKNKQVIIVDSLYIPDEKILDICLTADTAKDLGAKQVILVAPYLCYLRQDKRFHTGESISSKTIAKIVSPFFSKLITVDPHLHRYKSLGIIYRLKTKVLTANYLIGEYIKKHYTNPVIIGPDEESYQWAEVIAKIAGAEVTVCKKTRFSSRKVKVLLKNNITIKGKEVIIVDDIISTAHTMIEAIKHVKKYKPVSITCIGVHGLFVENAYNKLKKAGADLIVTTNSVPHTTNKIDLSGLISKEI